MKGFSTLLVAVLGWLVVAPVAMAAGKPVLVHYMPWFVAKPYSASWGWHWTMNHYNPDTVGADGHRLIASKYYPLIGPYDSADPVVLEYHCLLMKLAGADGVIVDWYGKDDFLDYGMINARTLALLEQTQRAGLSFALCYEDRTIQAEVTGGFIATNAALAQAQDTLRYAQTNFFEAPNYQRLGNHPLLLVFGPEYFKTNAQWTAIFSVLAASNRPAFFTEDNRLPIAQGAYNWPPMWLSATHGGSVPLAELEVYLRNFEQNASAWPAFISSAFPRFDDIYQDAGLGYTYGLLPDAAGETFRSTLTRAITNRSSAVQVVTWNDFGEGTVVEPTAEFGYRDLATMQDLRRRHLDPTFSAQPADLELPLRLFNLRRRHATNLWVMAELDRVADHLVSGDPTTAALQLAGLEAGVPVIYATQATPEVLQFTIGGFIGAGGVEVQMAIELQQPDWVAVRSFPAGTNPITYIGAPATAAAAFYRVRLR